MSSRRTIILVVAIVVAAMATYVLLNYVRGVEEKAKPEAAAQRKRGFHTADRKSEPERKPLTDEERSLEEHARRVRSADSHGAFRYHREPL